MAALSGRLLRLPPIHEICVNGRTEGPVQEPTTEPGLSDAAYRLFLHSLAVRTMRYPASCPAAMARRLGITESEDAG